MISGSTLTTDWLTSLSFRQNEDDGKPARNLAKSRVSAIIATVSSDVYEIEQAIRTLPRGQIEHLRDWIENLLEDQFEPTAEFKASIERGKADIAAGRMRVREGGQM